MFQNTFDRTIVASAILEEVIPTHGMLMQRLQKMRLRKNVRMSFGSSEGMEHIWMILKNEGRLNRQRAMEMIGRAFWFKGDESPHQVIANYEESVESKRREESQRLSEVDNNTDKIPLLVLMQSEPAIAPEF